MHSMTGFGDAKGQREKREISIEIKSVNHRFLDVSLKMPKTLAFLDIDIRNAVAKKLSRGHVDVYINYANNSDDAKQVDVDLELLNQFIKAKDMINDKFNLNKEIEISDILSMPEVFTITQKEEDQEEVKLLVLEALSTALEKVMVSRKKEGESLYKDIKSRINTLESLFVNIEEIAPAVPKTHFEKLEQRIKEYSQNIELDKDRMITEIALFADKCNIDEEIVRFKTHIKSFLATMDKEEPIGRKLDFTLQEINREINTIGSKANEVLISNTVVEIKGELEKIREQVQNIE